MRRHHRTPRGTRSGQAVVEFAIGGIVFFLLLFGTIDFGRAIFLYSELTNAVREGARYAQIHPAPTAHIQNVVVNKAPSLGLQPGAVSVSCNPGACPPGGSVTVRASFPFRTVTQNLLGIRPITLQASATNTIE